MNFKILVSMFFPRPPRKSILLCETGSASLPDRPESLTWTILPRFGPAEFKARTIIFWKHLALFTTIWRGLGNSALLFCAILSAFIYAPLFIHLGEQSFTLIGTSFFWGFFLSRPTQRALNFPSKKATEILQLSGGADWVEKAVFSVYLLPEGTFEFFFCCC